MIGNTLLYIDPGTGSLIGSTLMGLGLAIIFSLKGLFYKFTSFLSGKKNSRDCNFEGQLVFFCEGRNYFNVFKPILNELIKEKQHFVYLTADKDDPNLKIKSEYAKLVCLGTISNAIFSLNKLKAKLCVMTTPQLNILMLKRSKDCKHYCQLGYCPTDLHTFKKFAFDDFDSVLCTNNFEIKSIRELEEKRKLPKKQLFETGCPYYQDIKVEDKRYLNKKKTILLAPTWGEKSFLSETNIILNSLLTLDYDIIFRPHPQSFISDIDILNKIFDNFKDKIEVDKRVDNGRESSSRADFLICDVSGMIYDFAFMYRRPVLVISRELKEMPGYEREDLDHRDSAFDFIEEVGSLLKIEDINKLEEIVLKVSNKKISRRNYK